jgi:PLP dependent protein
MLTITEQRIRDNINDVQERIEHAAKISGRDPDSVKIVVVTKKQPIELIRAAIATGAHNLGENYADEALPKIIALKDIPQISWHMIGHVQSRKAEMVSRNFDYVHSMDSLKLAERCNRFAADANRRLPVLLQFNVSGEETKSGWDAHKEERWTQFLPDIEQIIALENLQVQGLMTMPPFTDDPEDARPYFQQLVQLRDYLALRYPGAKWNELSMGMSGDYEVAVQEGATWVRVGQAILGPRM